MIVLERNTSIIFSVHSLSLLKKLILHYQEKYYPHLMITWQHDKTNEDLDEKKFDDSVGVWTVLRFLVSVKNLGQYKKLPSNKFVKKRKALHKTFCSVQNFLELQCLVDDLVDF